MLYVLDSAPLSVFCDEPKKARTAQARRWAYITTNETEHKIVVPEIVDYELRRELLRKNRIGSLRRLDQLSSLALYLPITTSIMRRAAELWAIARQQGKPTAADEALDADMILLALAASLDEDYRILTTNVNHLNMTGHALHWDTEVNSALS